MTEQHPLQPWLPHDATLLLCGAFPPPQSRWSMEFYYPNFINDMWRIFGVIYYDDKEYFVDKERKTFKLELIKELLTERGIALTDAAQEVERLRGNASDKYLEIAQPVDLTAHLTALPHCVAIATTGEKAASVIATLTATSIPKTGESVAITVPMPDGTIRHLLHWRMPSSSRAYPMKLEQKADYYRKILP